MRLETLSLTFRNVQPVDTHMLNFLKQNADLKKLVLSRISFTKAVVDLICTQLPNLEILELWAQPEAAGELPNHEDDEDKICKLDRLKTLHVHWRCRAKTSSILNRLKYGIQSLKQLRLSFEHVTPELMIELSFCCPNLNSLCVDGFCSSEKIAIILNYFPTLEKLEVLNYLSHESKSLLLYK
jgi:hypothetical protein